ncbi:MAG: hypothetical protein EP297_02400 [Gammaproteobacteria bacterium]|nr:MAG: hypothetical protein EP297_02400 [Gammaproteobacteria bacterium]
MSTSLVSSGNSLTGFLAYAHAMECEMEEDLRDLAAGLKAHNNRQAAATLNQFVEWCGKQVKAIEDKSSGLDLPPVPPWDIPGHAEVNLHTLRMEKAHYLMKHREVLELVLPYWQDAYQYYIQVAQLKRVPEIQSLARRFAQTKADEIQQLETWLTEAREIHETVPEDLDPPHMPE